MALYCTRFPARGIRRTGHRDARGLNRSPSPPLSYPDYRDLRERNQTFSGILAYHADWATLTGGDTPQRINAANASANYFDVLGIKPYWAASSCQMRRQTTAVLPSSSSGTLYGKRASAPTRRLLESR